MGIDDLNVIGMSSVDMPLEVEAEQRRREKGARQAIAWVPEAVNLTVGAAPAAKIDLNPTGKSPVPRNAYSALLWIDTTATAAGDKVTYVFFTSVQMSQAAIVVHWLSFNPQEMTEQVEVPILDGHYVLGYRIIGGGAPSIVVRPIAYRLAG